MIEKLSDGSYGNIEPMHKIAELSKEPKQLKKMELSSISENIGIRKKSNGKQSYIYLIG